MTGARLGEVVAIAAVGANRVIGDGRTQPWSDRDDFARFRRLTMDQVLIMGRRTHEAIGRPLKGRHTVVLSRTAVALPGVDVAASLDRALDLVRDRWPGRTVFVAGGGEVYRLAWPTTTRLEITAVHQDLPGTVTFPELVQGATLTVPTLDSTVSLKIPPGTQSGRTFRVRGRGVPARKGTGDLLVTVEVVVPQRLENGAAEALQAYVEATKSFDPRAELLAGGR